MPRPPRPLPGLTGPGRRARWRRVVLRRVLSALLAATAVALVVLQLRPPPEPVTTVLVAARDVPAGTVLTAADLRLEGVPTRCRAARRPGGRCRRPWVAASPPGWRAERPSPHPGWCPEAPLDGLPPGRVALHVVSADPAAVDLLAPGLARARLPGGRWPGAGGRGHGAGDRPARPRRRSPCRDPPRRGVVLSLSATEADAVLAGHGSLEGPVTVTVVVGSRVSGGHDVSDPAHRALG